tara:strand:- start:390 stop:944 length:555 start_codon:yes stop_codon:yes gene_type:complete
MALIPRQTLNLFATAVVAALASTPSLAAEPHPVDVQAIIHGADGQPVGTVALQQAPTGVLLTIEVTGLKPGMHAVHVHTTGACDAASDYKSAGGHLAGNKEHGYFNANGPHPGDLPNFRVNAQGQAWLQTFNPRISLTQEGEGFIADADGAALIIHEGVDDYESGPAGNAGSRVGCAIISAARS